MAASDLNAKPPLWPSPSSDSDPDDDGEDDPEPESTDWDAQKMPPDPRRSADPALELSLAYWFCILAVLTFFFLLGVRIGVDWMNAPVWLYRSIPGVGLATFVLLVMSLALASTYRQQTPPAARWFGVAAAINAVNLMIAGFAMQAALMTVQ